MLKNEKFETLEKENRVLRKENAGLKEKLAKYENPKNSNNSSIPPSKDEHRIYKKKCSCCHVTMSSFPGGVQAPVSYGPMIESLAGYFHSRQHIPFLRMQELFRDIFSVPISEGGIHCLLNRLSAKALPLYHRIRDMVINSPVVGTDETGGRLNGKKIWIWAWQNERLTWLRGTDNRGYKTIGESFPKGFANTVLVHDCWRGHFQTGVQTHQLCTAHLLRELNYLEERYDHRWPVRFRKFILDGIELKSYWLPE
jgi:transposase